MLAVNCTNICAQDCASGYIRCMRDNDGDGFGVLTLYQCYHPDNIPSNYIPYISSHTDCNDNDATITNTLWYRDNDADGLGDNLIFAPRCNGATLAGYSLVGGDNCPDEYGETSASGCPVSTRNFIHTRTFSTAATIA